MPKGRTPNPSVVREGERSQSVSQPVSQHRAAAQVRSSGYCLHSCPVDRSINRFLRTYFHTARPSQTRRPKVVGHPPPPAHHFNLVRAAFLFNAPLPSVPACLPARPPRRPRPASRGGAPAGRRLPGPRGAKVPCVLHLRPLRRPVGRGGRRRRRSKTPVRGGGGDRCGLGCGGPAREVGDISGARRQGVSAGGP